jgi:hypothetical protein
MKLLRHIFAFIILVSLTACTSDDAPVYELNTENLSAGTYEITYLTSNETETVNINGLDIVTESSTSGETFQLTVDFFDNGTYVVDGQYVINTLVTVAGETVEESTVIADIDNEQGTYTANNNTMKLLLDETSYDVTRFNANELRLSYTTAYTEDGIDYVEASEIRMIR